VQTANFSFSPSEIRLPKGADINLTLANPATNGVVHDLTVPALGIHVVANTGETRTIGLRSLAAGRYEAYCGMPGHADLGMRATVTVG
jgi:heme/copper-type cytochrome/quinol oxidase subunit 2